jgi:hypothetical protein
MIFPFLGDFTLNLVCLVTKRTLIMTLLLPNVLGRNDCVEKWCHTPVYDTDLKS